MTPGKRIPKKKKRKKEKPLAMYLPRKDPIPNQDKKTTGLNKDQLSQPHVPPFLPGMK